MKKLFPYFRGYGRECVLGPLFKLLEALFELFVPLVVARIIDEGIGTGDDSLILRLALLLVLLGFAGLAFSLTAQYFAARAAVGFASRVRHALFAHIGRLPTEELDEAGNATLLTRLTSDMNQVQSGVNLTLRLALRSPFIVFGAMVMAFTIDLRSALIFAGVIPVLFAVTFTVMLLAIPRYRTVQGRLDRVMTLTRENLTGARVIRAFCREEEEEKTFIRENEALTRENKKVGALSAVLNPATYVLINGAVILLIYTGAVRVDAGVLTQGAVVALYNYMSQILVELIKLANLIINITKSVACGNRIGALLAVDADLPEGDAVPAPVAGAPTVEYRGVSLVYRGASGRALDGVSFAAGKGETVGVIGGTGSGKTSLVSLLYRAYDATDGTVLLDGRDVRDYPLAALRARIGVVPQKALLFRGSIRDNLAFGKPDATDDEMWEALTAAQAADFVREKPGGLDFALEAGGRNLSGGQRQRLTVARALVRRPDVLILDDSASALDFATEAALRAALRSLSYRPTVLIVSQRQSSIAHADRIVVLDEGAAVGIGRHEDLWSSCPVYREIYDSQNKQEEKGKEGAHAG